MTTDNLTNRFVVLGLTAVALVCLLASAHVEAQGHHTPQWMIAVGSGAATALAALATPLMNGSRNGQNGGNRDQLPPVRQGPPPV